MSVLLLLRDVGRVLYEILAEYRDWNVSYFEGSIFVKGISPDKTHLQLYRSKPVTADTVNTIVLQYVGSPTSVVIKGLVHHCELIQQCQKIELPKWAQAFGYQVFRDKPGIPVVLSIRRLFDPDCIYEEGGVIFFHIERGQDLVLEDDGTFSHHVNVEREQSMSFPTPCSLSNEEPPSSCLYIFVRV